MNWQRISKRHIVLGELLSIEREKNKKLTQELNELKSKKSQKDYYKKYSQTEKGKAARKKASEKFRSKLKTEAKNIKN